MQSPGSKSLGSHSPHSHQSSNQTFYCNIFCISVFSGPVETDFNTWCSFFYSVVCFLVSMWALILGRAVIMAWWASRGLYFSSRHFLVTGMAIIKESRAPATARSAQVTCYKRLISSTLSVVWRLQVNPYLVTDEVLAPIFVQEAAHLLTKVWKDFFLPVHQ